MTDFQHIHLHSHFSLMWGTASPQQLAERLIADGQTVFPMADRNGMYGMIEHLRICKRSGLRPVIGCELVAADGRVLCMVKTVTGYRNLCALLTRYYRDPRFSLVHALGELHHGLILITQDHNLLKALFPDADLYIDIGPGRVDPGLKSHAAFPEIPLVVAPRVYMLHPKEHERHLLMRAVDTNSKLSRLTEGGFEPADSSYLDRQTIVQRFAAYPKALTASQDILEACEYAPALGELIFPPCDYDHGFKALRDKTYAGISRRYGQVSDPLRKRADHELDLIRRKGFSNCFLVVEDVVSRFPLTCGRGSAAASLVSYALGITHVDPIAHQLFFERFLNPGRVDPPDIDIDFAWDERDSVRDYLWTKYGGSHIAMVCNHNYFQPTSAVRETAKVFGMGEKEMSEIRHILIQDRRSRAESKLPRPWPQIIKAAQSLVGTPRLISVHCGGVVITPDPITNHCPLRPMPIGYDVVPWEKDGVEDYGFVKLDFLGNRSLAVIRDTLASVKENYGVPLSYDKLNPINDLQTQSLIKEGRTMGCFYVESPATRLLLQKVGMGDYETLTAVSSIIRPAANKVAQTWVQRHRWLAQPGRKPNWQPIHPSVEETLTETHGLMVYQEDVSRTAMAAAGFNAVQADALRKIISKKDKEQELKHFHQKFQEGCRDNGLTQPQIDAVWEMILSFAGYSFCKPHSASYALVSFKSAFLKFHYPAEFMAAVISNRGGFYSTYAYLAHARRIGIEVLGPDINDSRYPFRGYNGRIRIGFMQIKGLPAEFAGEIIKEREASGPYRDLIDFLHRLEPPLEASKRLVLAGCFDELEPERNRPTLIWHILHWFAQHQRQSEDLFPDYVSRDALPEMENYSGALIQSLERKLFGFQIHQHPLENYQAGLKPLKLVSAEQVPNYRTRVVRFAGVLITGKTVRTHKGEPMCFLTFEDQTGLVETVVFPDIYRQHCRHITYNKPFLIKGEVVDDMGAITVEVWELERLDLAPEQQTFPLEEDEDEEAPLTA